MAVVSVCNNDMGFSGKIQHMKIRAEDVGNFQLYPFFKKAIIFINKHRKKGNVFVHCYAGKSRSGTVMVAYIMKTKKMTFK